MWACLYHWFILMYCRYKTSQELVSHDTHTNVYNYKHILCRDCSNRYGHILLSPHSLSLSPTIIDSSCYSLRKRLCTCFPENLSHNYSQYYFLLSTVISFFSQLVSCDTSSNSQPFLPFLHFIACFIWFISFLCIIVRLVSVPEWLHHYRSLIHPHYKVCLSVSLCRLHHCSPLLSCWYSSCFVLAHSILFNLSLSALDQVPCTAVWATGNSSHSSPCQR